MKKKCITILLISIQFCLLAQTNPTPALPATVTPKPNPPTFTWYGWVRHDINYDSRQNSFVREGQLDLYPLDKNVLTNGTDVNAQSQLNYIAILTRLGLRINGPDVLGAKLTGQIEGDFFGQNEATIGLLRLRHAYAKLEWKKTALVIGQTWYPLFIPEAFPGVVNFNTGIPIAPFGWAGQVKFTINLSKNLFLHLTTYKPREFSDVNTTIVTASSTGASLTGSAVNNSTSLTLPNNVPSLNATLPELNAHIQYKSDKFMVGAQVDYSQTLPYNTYRDSTIHATNINKETVSSLSLMAYTKIVTKKVSIKAQYLVLQDAAHWVSMGGYFGYLNKATGLETYKPANTTSWWIDIYGNGKKWIPGIFIGGSANNGAEAGATAAYGRAIGISNRGIQDILRISPRLEFIAGKLKFGAELEFTTANYGTRGTDGKVITGDASKPIDAITNTRFTFSTVYSF